MSTLTTRLLAPLLDRLFARADAATSPAADKLFPLSREEHARLMQSKTGYRDLLADPDQSGYCAG